MERRRGSFRRNAASLAVADQQRYGSDQSRRSVVVRQKRSVILTAQLPLQEENACSIGFSFAATALLLVPFLAVLIGRQGVLPLLQRGKTALLSRGELVVGSLSFGLGTYLGWQGVSVLMVS